MEDREVELCRDCGASLLDNPSKDVELCQECYIIRLVLAVEGRE